MAELVDAHVSGACGRNVVRVRVSSSSHSHQNAEIAQLVEHNLAKVRVASSSHVFRSVLYNRWHNAQVAELVDAHVSGACVERHAGSSPVLGTPNPLIVS